MVKEGLTEKVSFEQRLKEGRKGALWIHLREVFHGERTVSAKVLG